MHCINKVEVFKTNVAEAVHAKAVLSELSRRFPGHCINFDLEDCDKILRVEAESVDVVAVCALLRQQGFSCEPLA